MAAELVLIAAALIYTASKEMSNKALKVPLQVFLLTDHMLLKNNASKLNSIKQDVCADKATAANVSLGIIMTL